MPAELTVVPRAVRAWTRLFRTTAVKLSLVYLAVFAGLAVFLIGYIAYNTSALLTSQLDETIDAEIRGLAEQYETGGLRRLSRAVEGRANVPGASLYLLTDVSGNRIAGNVGDVPSNVLRAATGVPVPVPYQRFATGEDERRGDEARRALVRVYVLPGGFRLLVGRDLAEQERFRAVVFEAVRVAVVVVILLALATWVFVNHRVLKRIDAIAETSRRIMGGNLSERIPVAGSGDEFDRLAESLNAMLVRIDDLMRGLKEVSDDIAHDLKTPLNRLRARLEAALRSGGSAEDLGVEIGATIEDCDDLIRTFDALLLIARAEANATATSFVPLDLADLVADMGELYEAVAEEEGVTLSVAVARPVPVTGSRELLGRVVANLLDNALKYGRPDAGEARIGLTLSTGGGEAVLAVSDNGAGISAADRGRVMRRFVRLDSSRSAPGSGLGLSLVQAVVSMHRGRIELGDGEPGLVVRLYLPLAAAAPMAQSGRSS